MCSESCINLILDGEQERLLSVIQERTPALPRQTMEDFLATPPPWEVLCFSCGANADPEAKIKKLSVKKGKGSKKAAAAAAAAAAEEVWPALRCCICRRPKHVECLLLPGQARVSMSVSVSGTLSFFS